MWRVSLDLGSVLWVMSFLFIMAACNNAPDAGILSDEARLRKVMELYSDYKKSFPNVPDLTAEDVMQLLDREKILFVDVRKPEEQAVSMLPGAIAHEEFIKNPKDYADYLIIGYCTISYRSGMLAEKLQKKGIRMVNLKGGILAWLHTGGNVYKDGRPVTRVHVYGKKWNLAPAAFETIW